MDAICNKLKHYFAGDFSPNMEELNDMHSEMCYELIQGLRGMKNDAEKKILIKQHFEKAQDLYASIDKFPDFKSGLDWMNTKEPLSIQNHLRGKVVLLDFFTYCCINCMHIIPDLKKLENRFSVEDGLVVIGVHNAKFSNERVTANIQSAVERYGICHAVVNDSIEGMWSSLGVSCWPTQVILGPRGEPLLSVAGEGHGEDINLFISTALEHFAEVEKLSKKPVDALIDSVHSSIKGSCILRFPGKVAVSPDGSVLAVADTGHHRVVFASRDGTITSIAGGEESGFKDGSFQDSRFQAPQGLCFVGNNTVYLADTENHSIRKIDILEKQVTTVVGTGSQGCDRQGGQKGRSQVLASPWDLLPVFDDKIIIIAMAGTHQLWAFALANTTLFGEQLEEGICLSVVGSGAEENRNGSYRRRAGLAQPSGLAIGGGAVYFADSESSAIRAVSLDTGAVSLLAGGAPDPTNLFAYGDIDGSGTSAKLQHPLAVAWYDGIVYLADSYNHKLKRIDPKTRICSTIDPSLYQLNEPGGLCCCGSHLFIADTNNHSIKCMDLVNFQVKEVDLRLDANGKLEESMTTLSTPDKTQPLAKNITTDGEWTAKVSSGGNLKVKLQVNHPESLKFQTYPTWQLYYPAGEPKGQPVEGWTTEWNIKISEEKGSALIRGRLTECVGDVCRLRQTTLMLNIISSPNAPTDALITIEHSVKA